MPEHHTRPVLSTGYKIRILKRIASSKRTYEMEDDYAIWPRKNAPAVFHERWINASKETENAQEDMTELAAFSLLTQWRVSSSVPQCLLDKNMKYYMTKKSVEVFQNQFLRIFTTILSVTPEEKQGAYTNRLPAQGTPYPNQNG
ncbi:hypothetical protein Tco_1438878 [Tanacetum coccineum]